MIYMIGALAVIIAYLIIGAWTHVVLRHESNAFERLDALQNWDGEIRRSYTFDAPKWARWWDYITSPRQWCFMTLDRYSAEWDATLLGLMDKHTFVRRSKQVAYLGDVSIWVANYPYSSMQPEGVDVRASRATTLAAWRKLMRETSGVQQRVSR